MRPVLPNFDELWDYNKPDTTETKFRALLPLAEQSNDSSYLAQLLTQIARTEGLQRKFAAAHQTLDRAQALLTDEMAPAKIRYVLERGRVFNSSNHPDEARPLFLDAWEQASAAHEDFYRERARKPPIFSRGMNGPTLRVVTTFHQCDTIGI